MKEVILLLSAELDSQAIYNSCEDYAEGLGDKFADQLQKAYQQLSQFPESGPRIRPGYRHLVISKSPYAIIYTVSPLRVIITRIIDGRQDVESILQDL